MTAAPGAAVERREHGKGQSAQPVLPKRVHVLTVDRGSLRGQLTQFWPDSRIVSEIHYWNIILV